MPNDEELKSEVTSLFGVTFRKDQIPVSEDGKPLYNKEMVVLPDGKLSEQALVQLNDGTTVMFPKQNEGASIIINKYNNEVRYSNIQGLTVWDTPKNDKYYFMNCSGTVNAKREDSFSWKSTNGMGVSYGTVTHITSKDNDKIRVSNDSHMNINYTKGYDNLTLYK